MIDTEKLLLDRAARIANPKDTWLDDVHLHPHANRADAVDHHRVERHDKLDICAVLRARLKQRWVGKVDCIGAVPVRTLDRAETAQDEAGPDRTGRERFERGDVDDHASAGA